MNVYYTYKALSSRQQKPLSAVRGTLYGIKKYSIVKPNF
jgi:hypothetical protein